MYKLPHCFFREDREFDSLGVVVSHAEYLSANYYSKKEEKAGLVKSISQKLCTFAVLLY